MGAFDIALEEGATGEDRVASFYHRNCVNIYGDSYRCYEMIEDIDTQKDYGDIKFTFIDSDVLTYKYVEVKTDSGAGETGNIVVEHESNKGMKKGWLYGYSGVDKFVYYFSQAGWAVDVNWDELQSYVIKNSDKWKVVGQNRFEQQNEPVNYLVPYEKILKDVPSAKVIKLHGE